MTRLPITSIDEFSTLVGNIYDAAIEPALWPAVLEQIRQRFGFQLAGLGVSELPSGRAILQVSANIPDEYIAAIARFGPAAVAIWGGPERFAGFPLDEPILASKATDQKAWLNNEFYLEWARPQGLGDQAMIVLAQDSTMIGTLGLGILESSSRPTEEDIAGLRLLAPHIRRSVTISRLLERSLEVAETFRGAIEAVTAGVVIVGENLEIVFANASAEAMLREGDPIAGRGGRLALRKDLVPGQLQTAVQLAASGEENLGRRGLGLPAVRKDGKPLAINVMPLSRRFHRGRFDGQGVAAVFVAGADAPQSLSAEAIGIVYDLTPAEARVLNLLLAGHSTAEIAFRLAIGAGTVRTHLLAVFSKTDRRSRADLVRLSREFVLPVG